MTSPSPSERDGRFAPSPTGILHVGNLRTALLAWLFARHGGGRFLVRVEDLDTGRVRPGLAERQLADLAALGLDHDGEVVAQSDRTDRYAAAVDRLDTYECFCTRAEIREAASAPHAPVGAYPGTCRHLTDAERAQRRAAGRTPALRVRAGDVTVAWTDALLGDREGVVDDVVVRRADGAYAYNLAVVVDDAAQGIRQVVRGDDLADTTHRQVWLAEALGHDRPAYAHVPLVLGPDGARLAKRHGSVTLEQVGVAPALRWMARTLGLPGTTPREMLAGFDPVRVPRDPTVFDENT